MFSHPLVLSSFPGSKLVGRVPDSYKKNSEILLTKYWQAASTKLSWILKQKYKTHKRNLDLINDLCGDHEMPDKFVPQSHRQANVSISHLDIPEVSIHGLPLYLHLRNSEKRGPPTVGGEKTSVVSNNRCLCRLSVACIDPITLPPSPITRESLYVLIFFKVLRTAL